MSFIKSAAAVLLVLGVTACNSAQNMAATPAPTGLGATGSAGTRGGAAAPPPGVGVVGVSRP